VKQTDKLCVGFLLLSQREQIIDVAIRLFSEMGYNRATIEKIAEAGSFSQGLIYRYFEDKDDLLFHALSVVLVSYEIDESRATGPSK
jgi:AcrR family transcriptional regulator